MLPETLTELAGLISAISPLVIAAVAGLWSVRTKSLEQTLTRWKRLQELTVILNNLDSSHGLWEQIMAVHEIGESSRPLKRAAINVLESALMKFENNSGSKVLCDAIRIAIRELQHPF